MFCTNCGKELSDDSQFCDNCGTSLNGEKKETAKKAVSKEQDNKVLLNVKPKFSLYVILPTLIVFIVYELFMLIPMVASGEPDIFLPIMVVSGLIFAVILAITALISRKQYQCYTYDFYKTKVVYRDSFLNISEKEVKYKYIREVSMTQGFIQRGFKLGNIILYTNAESGFGNGIRIINVENPKEVFSKIKEVIGEE